LFSNFDYGAIVSDFKDRTDQHTICIHN
jgi:hypothetical protein